MKPQLALVFSLIVLLGGAPALAQDAAQECRFKPMETSQTAGDVLADLRTASICAGEPTKDQTPLVKQYAEITAPGGKPYAEPEKLARSILAEVDALAVFARNRADTYVVPKELKDDSGERAEYASWRTIASSLASTHANMTKAVGLAPEGQSGAAIAAAIPQTWKTAAQAGSGMALHLGGPPIAPFGEFTCPKPENCPIFDSRVDMLRTVKLMSLLHMYAQAPEFHKGLVIAKRERSRWEAYRTQGQHQYFWEVWVNGKVMEKNSCPTLDQAKQAGKVYIGFCEVPTSQWIILHPDAGLRWSHSANKSSELKPALIIETVGYFHWEWDKPNGSTMVGRRGYSLAAVYSDQSSGKKWSYGPMFHYDGYNIAITKSPGSGWGLMINLKLADRYFGRKQSVVDSLSKLNK